MEVSFKIKIDQKFTFVCIKQQMLNKILDGFPQDCETTMYKYIYILLARRTVLKSEIKENIASIYVPLI